MGTHFFFLLKNKTFVNGTRKPQTRKIGGERILLPTSLSCSNLLCLLICYHEIYVDTPVKP